MLRLFYLCLFLWFYGAQKQFSNMAMILVNPGFTLLKQNQGSKAPHLLVLRNASRLQYLEPF
jgi:hypothetical protein